MTGSDTAVYPPAGTQLRAAGIDLMEATCRSTCIGARLRGRCNAMTREVTRGGYAQPQPALPPAPVAGGEYPADKWVVAVAGTHGKSSPPTACWPGYGLCPGMAPGFLIGGMPANSAFQRAVAVPVFVVEADGTTPPSSTSAPSSCIYRHVHQPAWVDRRYRDIKAIHATVPSPAVLPGS